MDLNFSRENKIKDIVTKVDKLILRNKKLENDKNNLYSEYLLNLNKEYLFDTKFYSNKKENKRKQSDLEDTAFTLYYDIVKLFDEEPNLMFILKAKVCSEFFLSYFEDTSVLTKDLTNRCENYFKMFDDFSNNYNFILDLSSKLGIDYGPDFDYNKFKKVFDLSGKNIQIL